MSLTYWGSKHNRERHRIVKKIKDSLLLTPFHQLPLSEAEKGKKPHTITPSFNQPTQTSWGTNIRVLNALAALTTLYSNEIFQSQTESFIPTEYKNLLGMQAYYYKFYINVSLVIEGELDVKTLNAEYHCKAANGITASQMEVLQGLIANLRLQGNSKISHIK